MKLTYEILNFGGKNVEFKKKREIVEITNFRANNFRRYLHV